MFRAILLAAAILAAPLAAARAQVTPDRITSDPITPSQAAALEARLRDLIAGINSQASGAHDLHIVPDGDHYRLEQRLAGIFADGNIKITAAPLTAAIRKLDGSRWAIDGFLLPSPFTVTIGDPKSGLDGSFTQTSDTRRMHAVIDPSLATPSISDDTVSGVTQTFRFATGARTTTIARATSHIVATPEENQPGNRQVGMRWDTTIAGYARTQPIPGGKPLIVAIDRTHFTAAIDRLSLTRLGEMTHILGALGAQTERTSPAAKALTHQLVTATTDLLASADITQAMDGIYVDTGGDIGSIQHLTLSNGFRAPGGRAEWSLKLAMDGLDSPAFPPGPYRGRHIGLSTRLSGISKAALMQFLQRAVDDIGTAPHDHRALLLSGGPITLALDDLDIDLGAATLAGTGTLTLGMPATVSGHADIHATGLDALIRRTAAIPALKRVAAALIFLKGMGRQTGDDTHWALSFADHKLTVNDTDLSAMLPGLSAPAKGQRPL